jgi:alpha-D-xyloside xylohydrolase
LPPGHAIELRRLGRLVHVSRPAQDTWRVVLSDANGSFDCHGAAQQLAAALHDRIPVADDAPTRTELSDGGVKLAALNCSSHVEVYGQSTHIRFIGSDARLHLEIDEILLDGGAIRFGGSLGRGERIFGTGERFNSVDQHGKRIAIWAEDRWCQTEGNSYIPVPLLLSNAGYGLFVNRFEGMIFDLGEDDPGRWEVSELRAPLDLYVFLHDQPRDRLAAYADLTGHAPVPPDWAFGILVSRHARLKEFAELEGIREMARQMEKHDLPWSGAIVEGWPTYDTERHGELRVLARDLHADGRKLMVYDACGRVGRGGMPEFDPSCCVKRADGSTDLPETEAFNPADAPNRQSSRFVDITDVHALAWWSGTVWGALLEGVGVDGAKIDFCEQFPELDDLALADGRRPAGMHHLYPTLYNALMHRLFQEKRPDGGLCWSRGGGIGAQRYPFAWCGDQRREFPSLRAIVVAALSSGLSGIPFMGHDLGGYLPAQDASRDPENDVFVRGTQLACFGPVMQTHGTVTRPYDFPKWAVALYRLYSNIHMTLVPYLIEQARKGCAAGLPLMRHLYLHRPKDKLAAGIDDQYFLGEDILVCPVLEHKESRNVYLPSGSWENLFNGDPLRGPCQLASYPAPIGRPPVFVTKYPTSDVLPGLIDPIRSLARSAGVL